MIQFTRLSLLLGMAAGLMAATPPPTLSFGEITLVTAASGNTPATYMVNVILTTQGTTNPGQVAGLQFDLNYDPTSLNVTIGSAPGTLQPSGFEVNKVALSTTVCTNASQPAGCLWNPSTTAAPDTTPGQRAIVIGCCTNGQTTPASNLLSDGVVATLTVQATAAPTNYTLTLPAAYLAATSQGGSNVAATSIPLTVGAGASDPNATGVLNMQNVYLVGGLTPETSTSAPGFGSGQLKLADLISELLYETGAPGYTLPAACTDFFDAMDSSPADTATTRGGDGAVNLNDLVLELLRETGTPGYTVLPVRTPRGETCAATATARVVRTPPEARGSLVLGPVEGAGTSQERVPIYLEAGRDLTRAAIAFSIGDGTSRLQFQAGPGMSPSLMYDSQPGFVSVAFLSGFDARGGNRTLLGYIAGPTGSGVNIRVFGVSATGLNDYEVFGIGFAGAVK